MTTTISIAKPHGFRLAASRSFYASFTPGSGMAAAGTTGDDLILSFRLDRSYDAVVACLREQDDRIVGEAEGSSDAKAICHQISRMLGLEVDGHAWLAVGERDPIVGAMQRRYDGFFTAAKTSPYDAATWSIIAPRLAIPQAARIKMAISATHGDAVTLHGRTHHVFPAPDVLARIEDIDGLSDEKLSRLRGVAEAAADGMLDADRLRAMHPDDALAELQTLRGIGPWGASHIYYRGAAIIDALPVAEPRVLHAIGLAYATDASEETCQRIAEQWRPFRMWVAILMMRDLSQTSEWRAPHLAEARARSGRRLAVRSSARATTGRQSARP